MRSDDIIVLDALTLVDGVPMVKGVQPVTDDADAEPFGDLPMMQALGLSSAPWPADAAGRCEGVVIGPIGGRDAVCVGARDTRTAGIIGNLKPGDTVVHSTGPQQAAQLQLKEAKRQAILSTKTSDGKTAVCGLDGVKNQFAVAILGYMLEISEANGIVLADKTGTAGIQIKDGIASVFGTVVLGGRTPVAPLLSGLTPVGDGLTGAVGLPSAGVFAGA